MTQHQSRSRKPQKPASNSEIVKKDKDSCSSGGYDFPVGEIVGFVGLQGKIKVRPSTNNPDLLLSIKSVLIDDNSEGGRIETVNKIAYEKKLLVLTLKGLTDRNAVEELKGAQMYTTREQLENLEEEEWWVEDLVGLDVYTTGGELVGSVVGIIESAGQLLEISTGKGRETKLIPFVKDLVPTVDVKNRRIEINPIPGLLEL